MPFFSFFTSGASFETVHRGMTFDPSKDIPSLKGRVVLVTGGNSGVGKASVLQYALHEAALVFLAGRDFKKTLVAVEDIKKQAPAAQIEPLELDLGSFESIKAVVKIVLTKTDRLDILMLNAGVMFAAPGRTESGYETHFGTNHVGHALLTKLLLPTLLKTAEQPDVDVRVVVLSSAGIAFAHPDGINYENRRSSCEGISSQTLYGQSKLANCFFATELARRYPSLTTASIHPGAVSTDLGRELAARYPLINILSPLTYLLLAKPDQGAKNQLWASVSKDVVSGQFYTPVGVPGTVKGVDMVRNKEWAVQLWEWTEKELAPINL